MRFGTADLIMIIQILTVMGYFSVLCKNTEALHEEGEEEMKRQI